MELDGPRTLVMIHEVPHLTVLLVDAEECAIEFGECLLDDGYGLTLPTLHLHHGDQGIPGRLPMLRILVQIADATHHTGLLGLNEEGSVHAQTVTIIAIKGGGECTPPLIPIVVADGSEFARIETLLLASG